jgi:ABC-type branched-subunit amino acid transport system substrate-binding protein
VTSKRTKLLVLASAVAMTAAACGSSSKSTATSATTAASSSSSAAASSTTAAAASSTTAAAASSTTAAASSTTAAASSDPLGTPNKATGSPVKIGYIYDGQSAAIDNREDGLMAAASVKYANDYLGGLGGHVIDLQLCDGKQDAGLTTDCSNQMVQKGVAAVLFNVSGQAGSIVKPLAAANIPIVAFSSADASLIADKTAFNLSNPIAGIAAFPATVAGKNKFTKSAMIVIDVPGATGPAKAVGVPAFQAAGSTLDIVNIAPGTADMSPQVQAMLKKSPEMVHIIGNAVFCQSAIKALRDASYAGVITMISNCVDPATIKAIGAGLKGILVSYTAGEDPSNPDYKTYLAVKDKYAAGQTINVSGTPVGSFVVVDAFAKAMAKVTGDITPATVVSTLQGMDALPLPTVKGATFKCDGKAIPGIPIACTTGFATATLDATGKAVFDS